MNEFRDDFERIMQHLTNTNVKRCERWHGENGLSSWSALEWAGAMCGEAGEAANVAKKLKRIDDNMFNISKGKLDLDRDVLRDRLAREAADTFLYLNLMCAREGISLASAIVEVFNTKSQEYNFPERL